MYPTHIGIRSAFTKIRAVPRFLVASNKCVRLTQGTRRVPCAPVQIKQVEQRLPINGLLHEGYMLIAAVNAFGPIPTNEGSRDTFSHQQINDRIDGLAIEIDVQNRGIEGNFARCSHCVIE